MTIQFYNGKQGKIFNVDQTKKQYVTFGDLENYARTDEQNYFYFFNFFSNIRVAKINNIAGYIIEFLAGLSENIQDFISATRLTLTNISYNDNKTIINNDLQTLNIECNNIVNNTIAVSTLNTTKINSNIITNVELKSQRIYCNTIKCNNLEYSYNYGLFLYLNNIFIPVNKSISKSTLNFNTTITDVKVTLKPDYQMEFWNNNKLVKAITNTTNETMYFINYAELEFSNIKLYYKFILLI